MAKGSTQSFLIDRYLNDGKSVWVLNTTGHLLLMEFKDGAGRAGEPLRIRSEKVPMNLSNYYPPSMIKENPHLRRLIAEGKLLLMDPDKMEGSESAKPSASIATIRSDKKRDEESQSNVETLTPEEDVIKASPKVAFLCDSVVNKDLKVRDFLEKIQEEQLTEDDLVHITNELKDERKVVEWATEKLAALRENSTQEEELEEATEEVVSRSTTGESHEEYKSRASGSKLSDRIATGVQEAIAKKHAKHDSKSNEDHASEEDDVKLSFKKT